MLCDEVEPLDTDRAVRPAARLAASQLRVLATSGEVRSPKAKVFLTETAASDELFGPFSAAVSPLIPLRTFWDIQGTEHTETSKPDFSVSFVPPWFSYPAEL